MPGIVTSSAFRRAVLTWIKPFISGYYIRLFVNEYTPLYNSLEQDFVEPLGSWYQPIRLVNWSFPYNLASGRAEITEEQVQWIAGGTVVNESVWGYWVSTENGLYVWAERVAGINPYPMKIAGQQVRIIPRLASGALC